MTPQSTAPCCKFPHPTKKGYCQQSVILRYLLSVDLLAKDPRVYIQWYNIFLEKWVKDLKYIQRI